MLYSGRGRSSERLEIVSALRSAIRPAARAVAISTRAVPHGLLGVAQREFQRWRGGDSRSCRSEWFGQEHVVADRNGNLAADVGARFCGRPCSRLIGTRGGIQSRVFGPGERIPERRNYGLVSQG